MIITISGKHIEITESLKKHAEDKASKLPRYYNSISEIEIIIDGNEGGGASVEVIARAEHSRAFIGTETGEDAYRCIDMAIHKLERQLRRAKSKERDNKHTSGSEFSELT